MKKITSYQKLKNNITFLRQRGDDLEQIILAMYMYMRQKKIRPLIPFVHIRCHGRPINDVITGELQQYLTRIANKIENEVKHE